jgi:peptide/nickel transport system substrate-binding protein
MPDPLEIGRRPLIQAAAAAAASLGFPGRVLAAAHDSVSIAMSRDIQGPLDPANRVSFQEGNIIRAVCPGLIEFKPGSFDWQPRLAKSIRQASDTVIEFELNPGLQFHGGFGPLTADDVKFSFERFRKPGPDGKLPTNAADWEALDEVEVASPTTGRIKLKHPAPALWLVVLPDDSGCIISRKAYDAGAYRTDKQPVRVIGAGTLEFVEWVPNQRVLLRAVPGADAPFKEVVIRPVRDPKTAELALRSGELGFSGVQATSLPDLSKTHGLKTLKQNSINLVWLGINVQKKPFDDPRVRQAIRLSLDVGQILAGAYNGTVEPAYAAIAPGLLGYWKDAPHYGRDVAQAKKLLADAGVPNLRARLTLLNTPAYQNAGVIMQALMQEAGIQLDLQVLDAGSFWSMGEGDSGKSIELALQRFGGKADPAYQLQWFDSKQIGEWNWERWSDKDFDDLLQKAGAADDKAERERLYIQAQEVMDKSAAFIWLTHEVNAYAYQDWVKPAVLPNGDDMLFDRFAPA